jgi:Xaa-Pro aminopeptidase
MEKLEALRVHMKECQVDCFVCFHMDAHNSEYIAPCDERINYICGFAGTNAICVVT